jgi:two-component system, OmpR family, response regulator
LQKTPPFYNLNVSVCSEKAMTNGRVLIVDDDPDVRATLADYLTEHDYSVSQADGAGAMRAALEQSQPEVVLLDLNLPGEDGLSLARYLRERFKLGIGIIMVTGAGDVVDRIIGLEVGADDYLPKPFDLRELRARLKGVMRRVQSGGQPTEVPAAPPVNRIAAGRCFVDLYAHRLFEQDGKEVELTSMEFDLLKAFVEHPNRVLTRDQLLTLTRNREWEPFDRSIDIRIGRLRRKIEDDPENPTAIRTVRGAGYMFIPAGKRG